MYQIDNSTAAQVQPVSTVAGTAGFFTDGNPATGQAATVLPAEFMNMLMLENLNVLAAGGIAPAKAQYNQLAQAISNIAKSNAPSSASEAVAGVLKLSTNAQVIAGTDDATAVTPLKLAQKLAGFLTQAAESVAGILKLSTNAQVIAGTDDTTAVTPLKLSQKLGSYITQATESALGWLKIATQAMTNAGVDDSTSVTPKKLAVALQGQVVTAFATAGAAPAFTLSPTPAITAYVLNQRFQVVFNAAGGVSPTLNVSGVGAKNIKQYSTAGSKVAAIIASGQTSDVVYDGTDFVLLDQLPGSVCATPAQFDSSTSFANTAFIAGVGMQFSSVAVLSASTTLTAAAHAGALIVGNSASAISLTLPAASTMPAKTVIKFFNNAAGALTIVCAGADTIAPVGVASFVVAIGTWITLASNGGGAWYAIDQSGAGYGQTWQNISASRIGGTTYTNTSGRPISVIVGMTAQINTFLTFTVNGISIPVNNSGSATATSGSVSAVIPPGGTYSCNATPSVWLELR